MKASIIPLLIATLTLSCVPASAGATIEVIQDRESGLYDCGEIVTFSLRLLDADGNPMSGALSYTLTLDGAEQFETGEVEVGAEAGSVTGTLDRPGVLRCRAWTTVDEERITGFGGAAFDPEQIQPTATAPDDFDEWWAAQRELLAAVPMDARLEEREAPEGVAALYKVSLANVDDQRVSGWLALPETQPAPAVITFTAAGVSGTSAGTALSWAREGFVSMHIIHHNFDVEIDPDEAAALRDGDLRGYSHFGRASRDTYYFRPVILGCVRAIDLLTSRPEWDGEHLVATGSSQAGGLSLCLAGLDGRITAIAVNVPALCDHTGLHENRPSGWPRLIPADDPHGPVAQAAPYFDAVNFAGRFDGATWMAVGLIDRTCPAMTVYSAYNVLSGPKTMLVFPRMGHAIPAEYRTDRVEWAKRQVGLE
ncbi:MAG: acetylxylan esterase [Armatimonadota bacterium]|jgi:cephalosporin-C deacetylase